MIDYYLRFPDQATADTKLNSAGLRNEYTDEGDTYITYGTRTITVDIVGQLYTAGVYDENGDLVSGHEVIPGWHVNIRSFEQELDEALTAFVIPVPNNPQRMWA